MSNKTITYRKKIYFDYKKNTKTSYYAACSGEDIIIITATEHLTTKDLISSAFHTFTNKKDYCENFEKIFNNDDYMITKHEFNRLVKEFKNQFKHNCFI